MLVGGLWHGPSWTFVLWGLMHGIGLAAVRACVAVRRARCPLAGEGQPSGRVADRARHGGASSTSSVSTWVFFRSESVAQALSVLSQVGSLTTDVSNLAAAVPVVIGARLPCALGSGPGL